MVTKRSTHQYDIRTLAWNGQTYYFPMWRPGPNSSWRYYQEDGKNKRCNSLAAAQKHIGSNRRG